MVDQEIRWKKLTRDRIAELVEHDPVLLLPIGAIEQHGPHLPVDTDANSVSTVAERAAGALGPESCLVLPTIHWGLSPYWLPFAGTISLRPETILALMRDIGASVAQHGFRRMIILNGHGGNAGIIAVAATQMAELGIRAMSISYWSLLGDALHRLTPRDYGHIGHAGQTETSIQLHLQPEHVDPGWASITDWADLGRLAEGLATPGAYSPPLPKVEAPNGIYGDVTAASDQLGAAIVKMAADQLTELIKQFHAQEVESR